MVISISGLSSQLALKVIESTRDRQLESLRREPQHERGAEKFLERIADIKTPEEFVGDFEVYSFVMRSFDLEDQMFGRAMIRRILEADPSDNSSLVNRLTDTRFTELHDAMGFTDASGTQQPDFSDPAWQTEMVDRYFNQQFTSANSDQNETVGRVLHFRSEAQDISNWFDVLKDKELTKFFHTALNLPKELSGLDIDAQKRHLEDKFDLQDLADPRVREKLIAKFVAISDVLNPPASAAKSSLLQLFSPVSVGAQFVPITLNVPTISISSSALYRY